MRLVFVLCCLVEKKVHLVELAVVIAIIDTLYERERKKKKSKFGDGRKSLRVLLVFVTFPEARICLGPLLFFLVLLFISRSLAWFYISR